MHPHPKKPANKPLMVVLLSVLAVLVLCVGVGIIGAIAGIGSDDKPSTSAPSIDSGIPPTPDKATQDAYIAALKAIDPDIVGDKDPKSIVNRGRDQCGAIKEWPDDEAKLIESTNRRFTSPSHPEGFGPEKAKRILAVVREHICPAY